MANAWVQVNRVAHQALVAALSGRGGKNGAVGVSNGQVTLDLAPLEAVAKQDLVARGLTIAAKIPIVHKTFPLFPSKNLAKAQGLYRLINDLKIVLPILTLALLGLGVLAARGDPGGLIGAALGFAASMLVLGAGLVIARALYLNSVPASASTDAAAAAFDILVRFIKTALRTLLVAGLIVAVGAFFTWAIQGGGGHPLGDLFGPRLAAPRRRNRLPVHRPSGLMDLRAPACAAHRGGGAGRGDLRLLGPPNRHSDHRHRRPAAGGTRPHRTDRQTPTTPRASAPCTRRVTRGLATVNKAPMTPTAGRQRQRPTGTGAAASQPFRVLSPARIRAGDHFPKLLRTREHHRATVRAVPWASPGTHLPGARDPARWRHHR